MARGEIGSGARGRRVGGVGDSVFSTEKPAKPGFSAARPDGTWGHVPRHQEARKAELLGGTARGELGATCPLSSFDRSPKN